MHRSTKASLLACLALVGAGCSDFLSGEDLDKDPNRAVTAAGAQLFVASQVNSYYVLTGHANRVTSMWMQQMAGTDRQYIGYDLYSLTEGLFGEFSGAYTGGGLIDLRSIQAETAKSGNKTLGGIAKIWEVLDMAFVADMYGDAPYSEAAKPDIATPKLDKQLDIYAALQTVLDGAIADLNANAGSVGGLDLSFQGDRTKWLGVARTLKARLYLHTAEVNPGAYALALTQAQQGVSSSGNDLATYHGGGSGEENIWWQFIARDRDSYIRPGKFLVDLMKSRNDPRVPNYFAPNDAGGFGGAAPGEGLDVTKHSNLGPGRFAADFSQPLVTWAETKLIVAEAAYRTNNLTLARSALNEVRVKNGLAAIGASLSGAALLTAILEEKYVSLFQSTEVYNDWKRTCYPNITPSSNAFNGNIPARFTYPVAERSTNPNVPEIGAQPRRNQNDPVTATAPDGSACVGQKS